MSWSTLGINFRSTSGYVTDGTNETYSLGELYPTSRGGATFGWDATLVSGPANRNASNDRRLAGVAQRLNGTSTQAIFRLDLPQAGTYTIRLALGDAGSLQGYQYLQIRDNGTALVTIDKSAGTAQQNFFDATGTNYTNTTWPGSNSSISVTFASTIAQFVIGHLTTGANNSTLAAVNLVYVPPANKTPLQLFASGIAI